MIEHAVNSALGSLLLAGGSCVMLCVVLVLCACHKAQPTKSNPTSDQNIEADVVTNGKVTVNGNGDLPTPDLQEETCAVKMRPVSMPVTGSAQKALNKLHSRVKSQDHRALPEIPHATMATDDEEEDDGHYDVITGNRRRVQSKPKKITPVDSDSESLYAGIKETPSKEAPGESDPAYPGVHDSSLSGSTAAVAVAAEADVTYAQIEEKKLRLPRPAAAPTSEIYSPPPVPSKNYEGQAETGSPSLPPRNSTHGHEPPSDTAVAHSAIHLYETPSEPDTSAAEAAFNSAPNDPGAAGSVREPKYSKVTARESLDNLKRRQAHPMQLQQQLQQQQQAAAPSARPPSMPSLMDADYASVDYDEIRSPGAASSSFPSNDRHSMSSDLYAEIASSSGRNSTRSSTYARVSDFNSQAPPPPPVEVLRQLSRSDREDDIPDPGYSRIKSRPRPASSTEPPESTSPQSTSPEAAPAPPSSGQRSPLYAIVNKPKRQTDNEGPRPRDAASADLSHSAGVGADPGYQTIGSVEAFAIPPSVQRARNARRKRGSGSDYDPNYEKVDDFDSPEVHQPPQQRQFPWQNQEHIYQEISEAQLEEARNAAKNQRAKSTGL
ncbi:hypothetical protein CAPTEDRAFT_205547 [Capitella teleta]|uniref:Uncharacterized protein n=1 Tax=Capitella teleta TaxID=283909 RepID=R7TXI5_CAPTE|nr:hypothetical protein CAPTEDRAFT_205547 [Capitella teleta]|eukprot:ELT98439.1 hypothetical protein CAPTEDRAFT_205547 [Capitella teleta]